LRLAKVDILEPVGALRMIRSKESAGTLLHPPQNTIRFSACQFSVSRQPSAVSRPLTSDI